MSKIMLLTTKIRQLSPAKLARITEGSMRAIRESGHDVPMSRVRRRNGKDQWPVPLKVRRELRIVEGDFVVLCRIDFPKVLYLAKEGALDERDTDGRMILGEELARSKVRVDSGVIVITIKKGAQVVLGNVTYRFLDCDLSDYPGIVTLKIFETKAPHREPSSMSAECLRRWPVPVLDAAAAWRIAFEPFRVAMASAMIPPPYAKRDPRNLSRVEAVNQIMIETADSKAQLRRSEQ